MNKEKKAMIKEEKTIVRMTNEIIDMVINGASEDELRSAIKSSMVTIDRIKEEEKSIEEEKLYDHEISLAIDYITGYLENEFGGVEVKLNELNRIGLGCTTNEEGVELRVELNLFGKYVLYLAADKIVHVKKYESVRYLNTHFLSKLYLDGFNTMMGDCQRYYEKKRDIETIKEKLGELVIECFELIKEKEEN